jgi:hypothetical protein
MVSIYKNQGEKMSDAAIHIGLVIYSVAILILFIVNQNNIKKLHELSKTNDNLEKGLVDVMQENITLSARIAELERKSK